MTTVYADNAATTQMSRTAIEAMLPYMETIYGNPSSLHSVGQQAAEALQSARERVAKCLNASPREIYFTSGGSEADNQAILSASARAKSTSFRRPLSITPCCTRSKSLKKRASRSSFCPSAPPVRSRRSR